jgi:hypothetical protein
MEFKLPELPVGTKHFCLGALAGAALLAWAGFDAFGWKLDRTAQALASKKAESAVISAYAEICRAQFAKGADFPARLAALKNVEQYSRGESVAKGGWATMAGAKEPQYGVGQQCADLLLPAKT